MGAQQSTHAMARLGKLGSAMKDVEIEKAPDERLGLNMKSLVVTSIDEPSAAHRHGCNDHLGMRLVCVNGAFVSSAAEVREKAKGETKLTLRFVPKELPLVIDKRSMSEALGLTFADECVVTGVLEGSAAKRCNADQYLGLRVVTVNSQPVSTSEEVTAAAEGEKIVTLGMSIPLPEVSVPGRPLQTTHSSNSLRRIDSDVTLSAAKQQKAHLAASTEAAEIVVTSPNKWQHCSGKYVYCSGEDANGWPTWERVTADKPRWIYSTPNGYWRITDNKADFSRGAGYLISRDRHVGMLPHEMPMWQTKGYKDDPDITVVIEMLKDEFEGGCAIDEGMRVRVMKGGYVGDGGVVLSLSADGEAEVDGENGMFKVGVNSLNPEDQNEAVLWKAPEAGIGMRFDGPPMDLTLQGVVPASPADIFNVNRFVGRRVVSVSGKEVATTADVQTAVSGAKFVSLVFSPPIKVERTPLLDLVFDAEEMSRMAAAKESELDYLMILTQTLLASFHRAEEWHAEWTELKGEMKGAVKVAVDDGRGAGGAAEVIGPFEVRQDKLVSGIQNALLCCDFPLKNKAMFPSAALEKYEMIRKDIEAYLSALANAKDLSVKLKSHQEKLDELDDNAYKTKRELTRKPSDNLLKTQLMEQRRLIATEKGEISVLIDNMTKLLTVTPQLFAHTLPYEKAKAEEATTPEADTALQHVDTNGSYRPAVDAVETA